MSLYRRHATYSICRSLGTDTMPQWNELIFLPVYWRQLCWLLASSRHKWVWWLRSLLVSFGDSNEWPGGLLQATVYPDGADSAACFEKFLAVLASLGPPIYIKLTVQKHWHEIPHTKTTNLYASFCVYKKPRKSCGEMMVGKLLGRW